MNRMAGSLRTSIVVAIAIARAGTGECEDSKPHSSENPAAAAPVIRTTGGVQTAGAFGAFQAIAPGSWIEIYGSNLAVNTRMWASSDFNGNSAPTSLDGTSVKIGGQAVFVDYISPTQVNVQVPSNVGSGQQQVIITAPGGASAPATITVNATEPGLLAPPSFDIGGQQYVTALFPDGSTYVLPPGSISGVASRRAQPGDNITLYGVGFGSVIPSIPAGQIVQQDNSLALPFHLFLGNTEAAVTYAGLAPGVVGLYQFDVVVPTVSTSDAIPLRFTLNGSAGLQTLYISILNPIAAAQVQSVTLSSNSIAGGDSVQGTVTLSQPAPTAGVVVSLVSSSSAASVPATVTVPAGSLSATFAVSTSTVPSSQTATITASYGGSTAQAVLMVTPSSGGTLPQFSEITLSLTCAANGEKSLFATGGLILGAPAGGYSSGAFSCTFTIPGVSTALVYLVDVGFNNVSMSGQTFTMSNPSGAMVDEMGLRYGITSGTATLTLTPQAVPQVGSLSGTFTLVSALAALNGTVSGTYSAVLQ
jgi:uncharacterized protein (TIGR03437 family)